MVASLVYDGAYAGGRVVDDYVGVKAIAPSVVLVAPSGFGRVWSLAFTGAFFLTGAYRLTLLGIRTEFRSHSSRSPLDANAWAGFAGAFAENFSLVALQVAAPAVGLAFRRANRARRGFARRSALRKFYAVLSAGIRRRARSPRLSSSPLAAEHASASPMLGIPVQREVSDAGEKTFEATPRRIAKAQARRQHRSVERARGELFLRRGRTRGDRELVPLLGFAPPRVVADAIDVPLPRR